MKDLSKQSALSDISNILSTISNAGFFTPGFIRQIKASEPEVDPTPGTVNPEDGNVWELNTYPNRMEFINMQDTTLNMSITFKEDDDYVDPEHILDDPTPEELLIEGEEVEDITARMAALPTPGGATAQLSTLGGATAQLSTPGGATAQLSIPGLAGQFPDRPVPLRTNTVKIHQSASEAMKIYLARTPVPDNSAPNTWTLSKGLPTNRQHARIVQQYIAAMSSSPGMVTRSCTTKQVMVTRPIGRGVPPVTASGRGQVMGVSTGGRAGTPVRRPGSNRTAQPLDERPWWK